MSVSKRLISEYMESDELTNIDIKGNVSIGASLIMEAADDPAADGLFMRVDGSTGQVYGYKAQNQDLEWSNTNANDVTLGSSETLIIDLSIDHDITAENGSYFFSCKIKNGASNQSDLITLVLRDQDDNAIASKSISVDKGEEGFPVTFYGPFLNDRPAGMTFRVLGYGSRNSIARGTLTPIGIKVVEAGANPVAISQNQLEGFDFTTLPDSDPHIKGRLWVNRRGSLRVSQG